MCGLNNRGSGVVETSLVIPVVFFIIVMIIQIFVGCKPQGKRQCDENTDLFVASEEMIYGEAKDRLWRWQLYGDILQE